MAPTSIKDILQVPFGPYPDSLILDPVFKPGGQKLLQLRRLRLERSRQPIGLDNSEHYLSPPKKAGEPVFFYGVLVVEKLAWLSDVGRRWLQHDVRKRDVEHRGHRQSQNSRKLTGHGELTLEGLYGHVPSQGLRLTVWIRCEKPLAAMFLTAAGYPESLVLPSKNQSRCYEILSIDHHCYAKSQLFLERYRLVKLIKEIMANPKYDLSPNSAEVDNLVTAYLIKHEEEQLSHAVIFAGEGDVPPNPRLRHVSQAEVRGIFAAHSAWLLGFHLNLGQARCPLDVRAWCEFIGKVRIAKAAPASGDWGSTYDDDNIWDEDTGETPHAIAKTLAIFGGTVEGWERKLENAITKHPAGLFDDETSSASPTRNKIEYVWDSDYSECSTPGCSDSESDFDAPPFKPSPLLSRILQHILRPPALLPGRGIWDCPVPQCTHSINFFHLNERDVAQLTPRYVASYVRNKQYETLGDETVRTALCQMVSRHYISHLRRIQPDLAAAEKEFVSQILETVRYPDA